MKLIIDIPKFNISESRFLSVLNSSSFLPKKQRGFTVTYLEEFDDAYHFNLQGFLDNEWVEKAYNISILEFSKILLQDLNYYEYSGKLGCKMKLVSGESNMIDMQCEGDGKSFIQNVIKKAITRGYEFGWSE